jgi:hypothetical protein
MTSPQNTVTLTTGMAVKSKALTAAHLEGADVAVEGVLGEVHLAGNGHRNPGHQIPLQHTS